ncbi:MAG: glycosyltransferase [Sphingobium sp.]|nr:glycosyltransferase [Sphingobium sp.]
MFLQSLRPALRHIAVLGNALPRQCGLATYTSHSVEALRAEYPEIAIDHYAMDDGSGVIYGRDVAMAIPADDLSAYVTAGDAIRRSGARLLWLHHEFGIFGGKAGDHVLALLAQINIPLVVTLHTVLPDPNVDQMRVMRTIMARARRVIVMAERAALLLQTVYRIPPQIIDIIPHGAPDRPLSDTAPWKERLGLGPGPTVMTFGLLSPGKGIETAIRAIPAIVEQQPDLLYLIVGASHPAVKAREGEAYRESLQKLAAKLDVEGHIRFVDRFLDNEDLLDYLQAADIYLTPYPGRNQVTSGTLAYALAMGRPVVSTPYFHAEEALANGIGTMVPFGDSAAISEAISELLADPQALKEQSRRVWQAARKTTWKQNARAVMTVLSEASSKGSAAPRDGQPTNAEIRVKLAGIAAITDDVGIMQHCTRGVPDRRHGYCIDDNARALMLVCTTHAGTAQERDSLARIYASFVEHGWHEETGKFRNFMGYDRRWLEDIGSEDSNGRTLWALGSVARSAPQAYLRDWATDRFDDALPMVEKMHAPRSIAFSMLGMSAMLDVNPGHERCRRLLDSSLNLFRRLTSDAQRPDWSWFEIMLSYDNARLPQAMIEAGRAMGDQDAVDLGLSTLRWLLDMQKAPAGHFRPVGTESFGLPYAQPAPFDQQPLEALATIDACLAAWRADGAEYWVEAAETAYDWFGGDNDLSASLTNEDGTICHDGLTPFGVNLNTGAESMLALQMARHSMSQFAEEAVEIPQLALIR